MIHNYYLKAKVELLTLPIEVQGLEKEDGSFMNFEEYQATLGHTIERFSTDGFFLKGVDISVDFLDAVREFLASKGYNYKTDYVFIAPTNCANELAKDIWNSEEQI